MRKTLAMVLAICMAMMFTTSALAASESWSGFTQVKKGDCDSVHAYAVQTVVGSYFCYFRYDPYHGNPSQTCTCKYVEDSGGIDGNFGNGTRDAVKRFQTLRGLQSDGIVGEQTWTQMKLTSVYFRATDSSGYRYYGIGPDEDPFLDFKHYGMTGAWYVATDSGYTVFEY